MPRHTRRAGSRLVTSSPSNMMRPELGVRNPLIRLKNVVLPAPLGPITARSSPGSTDIDTSLTATRLPNRRETFSTCKQAHDADLRRMMPSTPRGKNSTISTKNRPMNDIQFSVWLEM